MGFYDFMIIPYYRLMVDKCLAIGYQCENNCLGVIHQVRNACDGGRGCRQTLRFATMGERRSLTFIT